MPPHVRARSNVGGLRTLGDELKRELGTFHRLAVGARVLLVSVSDPAVLRAFCLVMAELLVSVAVIASTGGLAIRVGPLSCCSNAETSVRLHRRCPRAQLTRRTAISTPVAGRCPARVARSLIQIGGICSLPMAASHAPSSPTSLARSWRYSAFLSALLNSGGAAANIEWASSP